MKTLLSLQSMVKSPRLAVVSLLLAAAPASQLHADAYSNYVTGLNPQYYLRLSETVITPGSPAADTNGSVAANLGSSGFARYQTLFASTTVTTGTNGGAIPGNAGVTTDGWSVRLQDLSVATGTTAFSLNLFVNPTSFAINDFGIMFGYGGGIGNSMLLIEDGVGGTGQVLFGRFGANVFTSVGSMASGEWNAVGLTYNGSDTIKLYLNGVLDTTFIGSIAPFANNFAVMGALFADGSLPFAGGLDEFSYFNGTVLTDAQMINVQIIPEPSTYALLGLVVGAFALLRRKRSAVRS